MSFAKDFNSTFKNYAPSNVRPSPIRLRMETPFQNNTLYNYYSSLKSPFVNMNSAKNIMDWNLLLQSGKIAVTPLENIKPFSPNQNGIIPSNIISSIQCFKGGLTAANQSNANEKNFSSNNNYIDINNKYLNLNGKNLIQQFEKIEKEDVENKKGKNELNNQYIKQYNKEKEIEKDNSDSEEEEEEDEEEEESNSSINKSNYPYSDIISINDNYFNLIKKILKRINSNEKYKANRNLLISKLLKIKKTSFNDCKNNNKQFVLNTFNYNFRCGDISNNDNSLKITLNICPDKRNNSVNSPIIESKDNHKINVKLTYRKKKEKKSKKIIIPSIITHPNIQKPNIEEPYDSNCDENINYFPKCKCSKSKCLKMYCECFANGRTCKDCLCSCCENTEENIENVKKLYKEIAFKNPNGLLKIKNIKKTWTCNCKNSSCKKNYCECFQNGKFCNSKCRCVDCCNKLKLYKRTIKRCKRNEGQLISKVLGGGYVYTPRKNNLKEENYYKYSTAEFSGIESVNKYYRKNACVNVNNSGNTCNKRDLLEKLNMIHMDEEFNTKF